MFKKLEFLSGFHPPPLRIPQNAINPDMIIQHYHTAQGRSFRDCFLFHIAIKGITLKDPRLFIMFAWICDTSAFPMKIVVFSHDAEMIFFFIQVRWMPPPLKGRPRGGLITKNLKKTSLPRCVSERPWSGCPSYSGDFYDSGVNVTDSCVFLMSNFMYYFFYGSAFTQPNNASIWCGSVIGMAQVWPVQIYAVDFPPGAFRLLVKGARLESRGSCSPGGLQITTTRGR